MEDSNEKFEYVIPEFGSCGVDNNSNAEETKTQIESKKYANKAEQREAACAEFSLSSGAASQFQQNQPVVSKKMQKRNAKIESILTE
jgi:hypothetical protein